MNNKITVNSHSIEFGYELIAVLPYAYHLFIEGMLNKTISADDTSCLYYFSPCHTENGVQRHWNNMRAARASGIPNINIHREQLDYSMWVPPPLASYYRYQSPDIIKRPFSKPTVVVSNKKNNEWGRGVINHLDAAALDVVFDIFKDWQIVYNSTYEIGGDYDDTVPQLKTDGVDVLLKRYGAVHIRDIINDIGHSYNKSQLLFYPHVDLFVSIQGGSSVLASYYGVPNIIYAVEGQELVVNAYNNWYSKLGGSKIIHVRSYDDLYIKCYEYEKQLYIKHYEEI